VNTYHRLSGFEVLSYDRLLEAAVLRDARLGDA
jgi:hypothetical protein